ncbi:hypothetical protein KKF05_01095 [Patescibacteria group bacterium]|nr:hypothetical protein [Patescibacteria group bacterium]MBU1029112.1 hypothetical protein [Patescibacteria group bacterium]
MTSTKTKVTTRTKVLIGVAVAGLAAAAAIGTLTFSSSRRCAEKYWKCSDWSECSTDGIQTRTCQAPSLRCLRQAKSPETKRTCTPPEVPGAEVLYPTMSNVSLPTSVLTPGIVIADRVRATAGEDGAVMPGANFRIQASRGLSFVPTSGSSVRIVGERSNIPGSVEFTGCDGSMEGYCAWHALFTEPLVLVPGTTRTLDLLLDVTGPLPCEASLSTNFSLPELDSQVLSGGPDCACDGEGRFSLTALPMSTLTSGTVIGARINVAAPEGCDVTLDRSFSFSLRKTTGFSVITTSGSSMRNVGGSANLIGWASWAGTGGSSTEDPHCNAADETCWLNVRAWEGTVDGDRRDMVIAGGTSRTFDLRLLVSGTILSGGTLSTRLIMPVELDAQVLAR